MDFQDGEHLTPFLCSDLILNCIWAKEAQDRCPVSPAPPFKFSLKDRHNIEILLSTVFLWKMHFGYDTSGQPPQRCDELQSSKDWHFFEQQTSVVDSQQVSGTHFFMAC